MSDTIKIKRNTTAGHCPSTSDLVDSELGVNVTDGSLFTPKNVGGTRTIVAIFGGIVTADPTSPPVGMFWYRSDLSQWRSWDGSNVNQMANSERLKLVTTTTYTVQPEDCDLFFVGATGDVTVTLEVASTCPGKRLRLWNFSTNHRLTATRSASDLIVAQGSGTNWSVDPGFGLGTEFLSAGATFGGGAWVVISGYGLDIFWGWMNKLIVDMANANYTASGLEWGITNTVAAAGDLFIQMPATIGTFNKIFSRVYDSTGSASGTKRIIFVPNGAEKINGVNANFIAVATAWGWCEIQGDANGNFVVSSPGTVTTLAYSAISATPTTLAGYGITDAAPLASPALTGVPTAPTAAVDTNTTQVATTAMVLAQAAAATPIVDGTAAVGTSTRFARADHVHPSDTSKVTVVTKKDGTTALTTFTMVTVGASNTEYLLVWNVAFNGTVTITTTVSWTDENGNVMTIGSGNQAAAGNTIYAPSPLGIFAKAGTNITVAMTVVSGTAAKAAYHFHLLGPI